LNAPANAPLAAPRRPFELVAEVVPNVAALVRQPGAAAHDRGADLFPARRSEEKRDTGAECRAETDSRAEKRDAFPVDLSLVPTGDRPASMGLRRASAAGVSRPRSGRPGAAPASCDSAPK
jgi:hypothetical protein